MLSTHLKDYIYITTFLKFQTLTPAHILNTFDQKHKHFKEGGLWRVQIVQIAFYSQTNLVVLCQSIPGRSPKQIANTIYGVNQ